MKRAEKGQSTKDVEDWGVQAEKLLAEDKKLYIQKF
jgi:hypothetical protein